MLGSEAEVAAAAAKQRPSEHQQSQKMKHALLPAAGLLTVDLDRWVALLESRPSW